MKVLIVYFHPEPQSFNNAMLQQAVSSLKGLGHTVIVSDLQAMGFDPVSGRANFTTVKDANYFKQQLEELHATEVSGFSPLIESEIAKVENCDLLILQFPLWWFGLPAPLKGWVDRVFAMGRTYGNGRFYDKGFFAGKKAMLSLTTGGPQEAYLPDGFNGDMNGILRPIHRGILQFVGFSVLAPQIVYACAHISDEERKAELARYHTRLLNIEKEQPIVVGAYR